VAGPTISPHADDFAARRSYTHPNIVGYVGAQVKGSTLSILMEWVPGGSVKQVVRDLGPLPEGAIAAYAIQAVRGLGWLHKRGVIHCDVKVSPRHRQPRAQSAACQKACA